jgi:hypothetical protein
MSSVIVMSMQQGVPQPPAPPAAPRVKGPLSQAEVRQIASEMAAGQREGEAAAAQIREAQAIAQQQIDAERAAQPNANEVAAARAAQARGEAEAAVAIPAPGTMTIRKDGRTITYSADGQPPVGEAISVETGPGPFSRDALVAETVKEVAGIIGLSIAGIVVAVYFFRTLGKWIEARKTPTALPRDAMDRLARIENAIEAMAVEVERISEGQRFTTRLLSEKSPVERAG